MGVKRNNINRVIQLFHVFFRFLLFGTLRDFVEALAVQAVDVIVVFAGLVLLLILIIPTILRFLLPSTLPRWRRVVPLGLLLPLFVFRFGIFVGIPGLLVDLVGVFVECVVGIE